MLSPETLVLRTRPSQVISIDGWLFAFLGSMAIWVVTLILARLALLGLAVNPVPAGYLPILGPELERRLFYVLLGLGRFIARLMIDTPLLAELVTNRLLLAALSLLPLLGAAWRSLGVYCTVYEVTTERMSLRTGVFNLHHDEIELFRVRDFEITQPFSLRIFGLGNLRIYTSDRTNPVFDIVAQRRVRELRDILRERVIINQVSRGWREVETT